MSFAYLKVPYPQVIEWMTAIDLELQTTPNPQSTTQLLYNHKHILNVALGSMLISRLPPNFLIRTKRGSTLINQRGDLPLELAIKQFEPTYLEFTTDLVRRYSDNRATRKSRKAKKAKKAKAQAEARTRAARSIPGQQVMNFGQSAGTTNTPGSFVAKLEALPEPPKAEDPVEVYVRENAALKVKYERLEKAAVRLAQYCQNGLTEVLKRRDLTTPARKMIDLLRRGLPS